MKMSAENRDKLMKLQDVLAEKYEIEAKMQEVPNALEVSTELLEHYKKDYIEKNAEYEAEKAKVAALKLELDEAVRSRELGEKNMDDIKTHREYEILDKQISEAQSREEEIRKSLQQEERKQEELNDALTDVNEFIKTQEEEVKKATAEKDEKLDRYQKELDRLEDNAKEASEGLDDEIVDKFKRIIQRNKLGIVAVKSNVCQGCHMILPYQFATEVRKGENTLFCPYCSRVIFYEETAGGEEEKFFSAEDTGSLLGVGDDDDEFSDEESEDELDENAATEEAAYSREEE
ncbi:MAG: nucleic acid-binding protein [Treponema sp.]|nr:nucleic acid-binding protein [Treponema sp.]